MVSFLSELLFCLQYVGTSRPMTKKAIGAAEFQDLPVDQKLHMLHSDGVYVGKKPYGEGKVFLFQLNSFYVEVYYKKYRREVEKIVTSTHTDILDTYQF